MLTRYEPLIKCKYVCYLHVRFSQGISIKSGVFIVTCWERENVNFFFIIRGGEIGKMNLIEVNGPYIYHYHLDGATPLLFLPSWPSL